MTQYGLKTLADLCPRGRFATDAERVEAVFPWHRVAPDGLWVVDADPTADDAERAVFEWHPHHNNRRAALPIPFSAADLAAFFLAGGGVLFFTDWFDRNVSLGENALTAQGPNTVESRKAIRVAHALLGPNLDEAALTALGPNKVEALEAIRAAHALLVEVRGMFGFDANKSAAWLLDPARLETCIMAANALPPQAERAGAALLPVAIAGLTDPAAPAVPPTPAGDTGLAGSGNPWELKRPKKYPGYRKALFDFLRAARTQSRPRPTARDVLDEWRLKRPFGVARTTLDTIDYLDGNGTEKTADLKAIQQAINNLTE